MTSQVMTAQATSSGTFARLVRRALATEADGGATVLRIALAVVMWPHGAQKLLGWFGGHGFDGTLGFLTGQIGLPTPLAAGIILLEFFGPILLVLGLGTRFVALGFIGLMLGAITTVHAANGFFMNWFGNQAGEGFEYHLLVIGMALALVIKGGGSAALDRRFGGRA